MEDPMFQTLLAAGAAAALLIGFANASQAQVMLTPDNELVMQLPHAQDNDRLVIVKDRHVIYDDGHDDLFCVSRLVVAGYTYYGRPIYRRTMTCR
jgi:hypothetical protein